MPDITDSDTVTVGGGITDLYTCYILIYTSGPQKMVDSMVSLLRELEVPEKQIKQEYFPGYD